MQTPTQPRTLTLAQAQVALCEGGFTATKYADTEAPLTADTKLRDLVDFDDEQPPASGE